MNSESDSGAKDNDERVPGEITVSIDICGSGQQTWKMLL